MLAILKRALALTLTLALMLCLPAFAEADDWWNILLLGTDNREEIKNGYSRTDSMIILSVNKTTKQAKLTSIMRDTWVPIQGHGKGKLNACTVYGGPALLMDTIEEQLDLRIDQYVLINITGLADVIDTLGGIELTVTEEERKALNKGLFDLSSQSGMEQLEHSGENVHLNGNQAVAFARIRKIDSDYKRTERQRTVLTTIARKLKDNTNPVSLVSVINSLLPYVETNLSIGEMASLAAIGLQLDLDGIEQLRLPADGTFEAGTFDGVWCIKADFEKNTRILHKFIYGE